MGDITPAELAAVRGRLEGFADDVFAWLPRLAERLVGALAPTAWVVDDTGFPKDGQCSVGMQRQGVVALCRPRAC
jgi:SRSO17 transposase